MITKLIRSVISILIAVLAVLFALGNRAGVSVTYSPVHDPVMVPVFVLAFAAAIIGFIAGGVLVWLNDSALRADRRKQRKIIRVLEEKLVEEDESRDKSAAPFAALLPRGRSREEKTVR